MKKVLVLPVALVVCLAMVASADVTLSTVQDGYTKAGAGDYSQAYDHPDGMRITAPATGTERSGLISFDISSILSTFNSGSGSVATLNLVDIDSTSINTSFGMAGVDQVLKIYRGINPLTLPDWCSDVSAEGDGGGPWSMATGASCYDTTASATSALPVGGVYSIDVTALVQTMITSGTTGNTAYFIIKGTDSTDTAGTFLGTNSTYYDADYNPYTVPNPTGAATLVITPEPMTLAMLAIGGLGMLARRNRKA